MERYALEYAYTAGWCAAANWADREDLAADIDSAAYAVERDSRLQRVTLYGSELYDRLQELYTVLRNRHHGRMPEEVQKAYDRAGKMLNIQQCIGLTQPVGPTMDKVLRNAAALKENQT